jgi:hypothetical protein
MAAPVADQAAVGNSGHGMEFLFHDAIGTAWFFLAHAEFGCSLKGKRHQTMFAVEQTVRTHAWQNQIV